MSDNKRANKSQPNIKARTKQQILRVSGWMYRKNISRPRVIALFKKVNNKLRVVNSIDELQPRWVSMKDTYVNETRNLRKPKDLKVAVILDEFSYNSFRFEFNAIVIAKNDWLVKFQTEKPDLFLCESAWSGIDSKLRPWQGSIYASKNFPMENRTVLLDILDYCKQNDIPTIFWNKEDPSHYEDRVHDFVTTAILFDHIFTTDENCVERYKKEYGHKSVHSLMFATQPKMFNPIKKFERSDEIIFAGSWYAYHENRCKEMEKILDGIISSGYKLKIYDRYHGVDDPNHLYPDKYKEFIYPALPFQEIEKAYKESWYALNFTTVTESPTMFARRVFELMSTGTYILSNYSFGIEQLLGDNVCFVDNEIELPDVEAAIEKNLNLVLSEHTYSNRFNEILNKIDFPYVTDLDDVSIVYVVDDDDMLKNALNMFKKVNYSDKECIIFLSAKFDDLRVKDVIFKYTSAYVKIFSVHYIKKYAQFSEIDTKFFIINPSQETDFISRAVLHFKYLEADTAVACHKQARREKYCFENILFDGDRLFDSAWFIDVIEASVNGKQFTSKLYFI